jgi:rubredoxin
MSLELDYECPTCGGTRTFYRAASTTVQLGEKVKWRCPDCGYGFVAIGKEIDPSTVA